ncbi:hypothetical protein, partial [Pseudomonas aeruginosa]|uniref:hypothetical protein n=1 Tax=Pseudomonas aeruginosa TaxID=287 RepID=UPI003978007C
SHPLGGRIRVFNLSTICPSSTFTMATWQADTPPIRLAVSKSTATKLGSAICEGEGTKKDRR